MAGATEHVLRLQVAVDDPLGVRRGEPTGDQSFARRHRTVGQPLAQAVPFEQLGDQVRRAVPSLTLSASRTDSH